MTPTDRHTPTASTSTGTATRTAPPALRAWRYLRLVLHLLQGVLLVLLLYPLTARPKHQRMRQRWSRGLLSLLGVKLSHHGETIERGCLLVANHVSWLDIFVINALSPTAFVSKAEVRHWPLIGWLAARNDTVFLRRGSRGHAKVINTEIGVHLDAGKNVAVFPEGTTTDGSHLLHFHAALLQPAIESAHPVQAIAIRYQSPDGQRSCAPAYAGDTSLGQCLAAIIATHTLIAHTEAFTPIPTDTGQHRREIARLARESIIAGMSSIAQGKYITHLPAPLPHPPA